LSLFLKLAKIVFRNEDLPHPGGPITAIFNGLRPSRSLLRVSLHCSINKSSFLNTIFASFKNNDKACWKEIAKAGDYGQQDIQKTSRLRM
jgi:hypothetical protein